jgi:hypothetical protein
LVEEFRQDGFDVGGLMEDQFIVIPFDNDAKEFVDRTQIPYIGIFSELSDESIHNVVTGCCNCCTVISRYRHDNFDVTLFKDVDTRITFEDSESYVCVGDRSMSSQ